MAGYVPLRGSAVFANVQRQGRRRDGPLLGIRVLGNGLETNRYGYTISKRVGSAVVRNRIRRRLRHLVRDLELAPGSDIVIGVRPAAAGARFSDLKAELDRLVEQAGLTTVDKV
jgi:ribonuclease P protein component